MESHKYKIAVIGQGYVGLPLALAFSRQYPVIGFDIDPLRVQALNAGLDKTLEVEAATLKASLELAEQTAFERGYRASSDVDVLAEANIYIVTVPTPIDQYNAPDLRPLLQATEMIGQVLRPGDLVIYESTVYPGCTEEECVPLLARVSGLIFNTDFFVGYSPERIVPGDKLNTLSSIIKVTSGSTPEAAEQIDALYRSIIPAGTFKAASIKVAEAAKAIENAQRDVNISFINELALIFDRIGIDTQDVLEAAGTKFNFLKFKPGLVGGHCISVDPYYLAHKASQLGYHPEVILSGRRVNERMADFVVSKVVKLMLRKQIEISGAKVLVLGMAFKENCPDIRNSKVIDMLQEIREYGMVPEVYDPWIAAEDISRRPDIPFIPSITQTYDAIILAVAHQQFLNLDFKQYLKEVSVLFDCKAVLNRDMVDARL